MDENGATYDRLHLRDWFNNPHPLLKADVLDGVMRGLTFSNPEASDDDFVSDVSSNHRFLFYYSRLICLV